MARARPRPGHTWGQGQSPESQLRVPHGSGYLLLIYRPDWAGVSLSSRSFMQGGGRGTLTACGLLPQPVLFPKSCPVGELAAASPGPSVPPLPGTAPPPQGSPWQPPASHWQTPPAPAEADGRSVRRQTGSKNLSAAHLLLGPAHRSRWRRGGNRVSAEWRGGGGVLSLWGERHRFLTCL